jgi:hypothetical protein
MVKLSKRFPVQLDCGPLGLLLARVVAVTDIDESGEYVFYWRTIRRIAHCV